MRPLLLAAALALSLSYAPTYAQDTRDLEGIVSDLKGNSIAKAIVQIEDTATLQVRSYIANAEGKYYFLGLSSGTDYRLRANYRNHSSGWHMLTRFDARRRPVVNLKIDFVAE